jgi:hypothetical protein
MAKKDDDMKKLETEYQKTLERIDNMLKNMDKAKELRGESRRRKRQLGEPAEKKPKNKPNQQDRNDPTGIEVRDGGAIKKTYSMREGGFTKRGGMYKKGY